MLKMIIYPILILLSALINSFTNLNTDIYVSPYGNDSHIGTVGAPVKTIKKAFELVAGFRVHSDQNVTVHLQEGSYHLMEPLQITHELGNLSLVGAGADKVIVKGSKVLDINWKVYKNNIWVAEVSEDLDFNQLFIDGSQQVLARYPNYNENGGYWQGYAKDAIDKQRVATWKNPVGGFVHAMHNGRWGGFHFEITGVDSEGEVVLKGGHQNNRPSKMHPEIRMVENIFEELDAEKEWFYDKSEKKLYLMAEQGVNLNNAVVEVSVLKHLVNLSGSQDSPVENVHIEGIRFEQTMRTFMEDYDQLLRSDWTIYRGGAITMDGAMHCSVVNCEFTNLGGNVIYVNGYNRDVKIKGNHIYNCGASAVSFVGDTSAVRSPSFQYGEFVPFDQMDKERGPANDLYPSDCTVSDNLIYRIGRVEKQVAGVQISMAMNIHVDHNTIYDVPRAGINVSEGTWGGHLIENNDVFNTVLETSDHGAFNSWGRDRFWYPNRSITDSLVHANPEMPYWDAVETTIIRNNRFRCDHGWDIDLDDGSTNYHIYNNLCLNGGIKLREGYYRVVENNIMVNNGFHPHVWFDNSEDVFKHNIMMTKHFDIRLKGWGKEVDYNLFPDDAALQLAQKNKTDQNSVAGDPMFKHPASGDFSVESTSKALDIGFKNFRMDNFGVQKESLKAIAKHPDIPKLVNKSSDEESSNLVEWLGGSLKNVESLAEQSASGLPNMEGVIVLSVQYRSKLGSSGIQAGDAIVGLGEERIRNISELIKQYDKNLSGDSMTLDIFRHQKRMTLKLKNK
ncbi:PDZ domain-containing protein [Portibacter lacus]|uniref:Peptide-binding protein n=1 Tax=Portibacter lacus TaxID=1099794 RepID=A0AA37SMK8_9BACT|nr:PDZ domain-containing protein [Portibacter lacus]GLR17498.1 peptide-binding protein [Portibacter lacus]